MNVVIRVDAGTHIGTGHVMRCLVLADALFAQGCRVSFVCLPLLGDLRDLISQRGYSVISLSQPVEEVIPTQDTDYLSWLQRDVIEDALEFVAKACHADLVITDHYAIGKQWHQVVKEALKCKIMAIDDLVREHDADLIIDQTLNRCPNEYQGKMRVLAGSSYALLADNFAVQREQALEKKQCAAVPKILISLGGVDTQNITFKVLENLVGWIEASFTVLLSQRAPHYHKVSHWCADKQNVQHLEFVTDMASLMLEHDIAIGAPGTTSWERACLGLPCVIIPLADNQKTVCRQLVSNHAAIKVKSKSIKQELLSAVQRLVKNWSAYQQTNFSLCDGRGARRVLLEIKQLVAGSNISFGCVSNDYELVSATENDIKLVYQWQSNPLIRQYALNPEVPSWDEHFQWMTEKLKRVQDNFYLIKDKQKNTACGVLRLDRLNAGNYLVSIFIEPQLHGKGIALAALALADLIYPDVRLHATVLEGNYASQKLFEKAGYQRVSKQAFIRESIR